MLEDDTPELAAEEAIEGETLKIQGALIETTTTDPERAQEGNSGEVGRRRKRPASSRTAEKGRLPELATARENSDGGDLCSIGVAWPKRTKPSGRRSKLQLRRRRRRRR